MKVDLCSELFGLIGHFEMDCIPRVGDDISTYADRVPCDGSVLSVLWCISAKEQHVNVYIP